MSLPNSAATTLLASLVCYLFLKRYEPTDVPLLVGGLVVPPLIVTFLQPDSGNLLLVPGSLLRSCSLYYSGLLFCILAYQMECQGFSLHPLSKYPGPIACRISKLWLTFIASRGKLHIYVKELHDAYGLVIRIVSLVPSLLGANGMPKGPLWDGRRISGKKGPGNLIGARDLKLHAEARKAWNKEFNPAAVKGYEPILIRRVTQLVESLRAQETRSVNLSQWLSFFSFDFMGDMVFGGGFELMRDGDKDEMKALGKFALDQAKRRLQEGSVHSDLFYYLIDDKRTDAEPYPFPLVVANSVLAIIAGSDTSATVLANTLFFLLSHPESYKRLQLELDEPFPGGVKEPTDAALLSSLPYLNAVIKESLRLLPPVATSLQRAPTVGTGVKVLGEDFIIREGTSVVPPYTMHCDTRYFSPSPDKYLPERWLGGDDATGTKFVVNEDAFIPFSTGPANCAGKSLAMLEIRMVVAYVMQAFELRFADGYDEERWEDELKDYFAMQKGSLPVVVASRAA
ncbi:cytochrome P450, partial [Mycena albidolilacea]